MIEVVVSGAAGRMGRLLVRLVGEADDLRLHAAVERPGHADLGADVGSERSERPRVSADLAATLARADVLIDFSTPAATVAAAAACARAGVAAVMGTTGLDAAQKAAVAEAARRVPIVAAPNMSVGMNVVYRLVAEARRLLGDDYARAIFEAHHRMKKDAPSGTALALAEAGGVARDAVVAVRGGDVVGEHTVYFLGDGERIEITHRASSREAFARGALRAARWIVGRPAGFYDMGHVLGLVVGVTPTLATRRID